MSAASGVFAAAEAPAPGRGIAFVADSGFAAYPYTGHVVPDSFSGTAGELMDALVNSDGVSLMRGETAVSADDTVKHGDTLVVKAEDGTVIDELEVIFMGDTNKDNKFNLSDVATLMKKIAKWDIDFSEFAADLDADGNVNLSDAALLMKAAGGWDVELAKAPTLPGKFGMTYRNKVACNEPLYSGWVPLCLSDGIHYDLGVTFKVEEGEYVTSISALCPSFADNEGKITFSVYKWMGDYATTIAATPVTSIVFMDYEDNATLTFDLKDSAGKGLVAGEYLWRMHDCYDDPEKTSTGVGIWYYPSSGPEESKGMRTFLNQKEFNIGPVVDITYSYVYQKK